MIYSIPLVCKAIKDSSWPSVDISARKNHGTPSDTMIANDDAPIEFETPTLLLPVNMKRISVRFYQVIEKINLYSQLMRC